MPQYFSFVLHEQTKKAEKQWFENFSLKFYDCYFPTVESPWLQTYFGLKSKLRIPSKLATLKVRSIW